LHVGEEISVSDERTKLGRQGETLAVRELVRRGYEIAGRNWHCQIGEVDVVALRGDMWTFFEVRTRRGRGFGTPEESLTSTKIERMVDVARTYLAAHDINVHEVDWRIGLVAVEMDRAGYLLRVDVYENIW
jgi:putative endonuclease